MSTPAQRRQAAKTAQILKDIDNENLRYWPKKSPYHSRSGSGNGKDKQLGIRQQAGAIVNPLKWVVSYYRAWLYTLSPHPHTDLAMIWAHSAMEEALRCGVILPSPRFTLEQVCVQASMSKYLKLYSR